MTLRAQSITLSDRLEDVSCEFHRREITAICGPNGAGKSSLLQVMAGLIAPESGQILLDGSALPHGAERAKRIGYLPQAHEIAWDVAVRHIVELGRIPHRDAAREPVEAAIAALDLEGFEDRRAQALSGGEQARVLLARVLAGEPEWILADEPLAALDLAHQHALAAHLARSAKAGAGVVVVLHDLAMARNHADRVIVLDHGKVAVDGAPEEALSVERIAQVWGVQARWLGEHGAKALAPA